MIDTEMTLTLTDAIYAHVIVLFAQMFCGVVDSTRTAAVLLFDLRSTKGAVRKLRAAAKQRQPVHGICHTKDDRLVCATMGGVWGWEGGTTGGEAAVDTAGGSGGGGDVEQQQEQMASQLQIQVNQERDGLTREDCPVWRVFPQSQEQPISG